MQKVKHSIYSSASFVLLIISLKIILKELLSLTNLTKTQLFYVYELIEVIMVGKNKDFIFAIFNIMSPDFKGFNNS